MTARTRPSGLLAPLIRLFVSSSLILLVAAAESDPLTLPMQEFEFVSKGNFTGRLDRRNLFQIEHPLAESASGDYGFYRAEVEIPPDAKPPHLLYFYATDNNIPAKSDKGYMMIDQKVGHRFKQIRINGQVVWSEDTHLEDSPKWKVVDITESVQNSESFILEAGLYEAVASETVLHGDLVKSPPKKAFKPKQEWNQTESYWGDFTILSGPASGSPPPEPRWNPNLSINTQLAKTREAWNADAVALENFDLVHSGWSWPAVTGIPFPEGRFPAETRLQTTLSDHTAPIRPLAYWPDGSLKWGLAQVDLKPGFEGSVRVTESNQESDPEAPVTIKTRSAESIELSNDLIRLVAAPNDSDSGLRLSVGDDWIVDGMQFYFEGETEPFSVEWKAPILTEQLPERVEIELSGDLVSDSGFRYGRCRVRLTVFANHPYVRIESTVYNETDQDPFRALAYGWKLRMPKSGTGQAGDQWFTVETATGALTGAIRYFKQLGPNAISIQPGQITLELFKPGDPETPFYQTHPGEAKTHEIWLAATKYPVEPAAARRFAMLVDRPPGLAVASLIRSSAVWGPMPKLDPVADAKLIETLIDSGVESYFANVKTGLRPFGNYPGFSSSFYWNSLHSMYALYAMTGERKWLDRAERSVRHFMDLLVCHWSPDVRNIGGTYSYYSTKTADGNRAFEPDFSNADFSIRSQNPHPAFNHWQLTGDPDGKAIGIGIADFLISNPTMVEHAASGSARHQGWALIALARADQETGDTRYRDYARKLIEIAKGFIDPRRGAYLQIHSSVNHPGIVPFMAGILATGVRHYHEVSNDPVALELLAQIVTAGQEETVDRTWSEQNPGISYFYSPNPHHRYEHVPGLSLGFVGGNAYLGALTGNQDYTLAAQQGWDGFLAGPHKSPNMEIYNLPDTLFWLKSLPPDP